MAYPTIKIKKSSVSGKVPVSGDLDYGELALNYNDGKLYYKNSSNVIKTFLDSANIVDLIDSAYVQARQSPVGVGTFDSADFNSMFAAKSTTNLSEGTNKYYTKARADSDDKYPTTFTYTAGTTAGPTGSLTGTNLTAISFAAIPSAGASASGIITTGAQTIAGAKTFSSTISGSIDGNAGTATTLATGRNFSLTGEVTAPAISFNGSGVVALATTIATDAVDSSNILALSVSSGKIQNGAITAAKFATGAVDSNALGALSVSSAKLQGSIPDSKLATISTALKVSNSATTATDANTASAIVARDASGNFSAGTITATLSGSASTLTTSRNFSLTGPITAPAISFNGSGAVALSTSITAGAVDSAALGALSVSSAKLQASIPDSKLATISTALKVSNSATTATNLNTASAIVARDASGNFAAGTITAALTGNASTATTLANSQNFSLTGDVTAPAISFNGSGAVALATTIATDAVDSSNILALSISSGKIQTGAITTAKFATGAVDSNALGALSVSTTKIQGSAVTYAKMQTVATANRVLGSTTAAGAVSEVQIATGMIATGAVDSNALGALSVSSAKLQASIPDSKLATISTALKVSNSATTATDANTASAIVARDASGNFTAGTITATLSGSATTLATGRNFSLTGEVTAPAISFNGSGAVALATTIATDAVDSSNILALSISSGKIQTGAITTAKFATGAVDSNALGALSVSSAKLQASIPDSKLATIATALKVSNSATTATNLNTASAIVARDASGNFSAGTITAALTGNASTATTLASGQNFSLTGPITAPAISFNGSGAVALSTSITAGAVDSAALGALSVSSAKLQASIPDSKLATIATALKVSNSATTATNLNTASAIVARDGSGNFTAGTITAALTGNASTATTLANSQNFSLTGDVTAPAISFNGSGAVALATTIAANAVDSSNILALSISSGKIQTGAITTAKFATGAVDSAALGALSVSSAKLQASIPDSKLATISTASKVSNSATTATDANTASAIVARDASGNFTAGTITAALTGNASTATTLQTARTIAISGDVTGTATSFNGSANIAISATITAGSIVSADFSSATSLIIYNSAGTVLKTIYSPST